MRLLTSVACLAMAMALPVSAQERENQDRERPQAQNQQQQEQQGQQQTIRGTVAGVTTIGEAVIDPQTGTAVAVQTNYVTVLGAPVRGQQGQRTPGQRRNPNAQRDQQERQRNQNQDRQRDQDQQRDQDRQRDQQDRAGQDRQAGRQRQNLYLVAVSAQTEVREGGQQRRPGQDSPAENRPQANADREQAQSVFEKLEIGDRVTIEFKSTGRLQAKADAKDPKQPEERVAGFRGNPRTMKHGRNRIFVGEASEITIMADTGRQRGPRFQPGQDRPDQPRQDRERQRDNTDTDN